MLHIEELQSQVDIRAYDLNNVTVRPHQSRRFILKVSQANLCGNYRSLEGSDILNTSLVLCDLQVAN